MPTLLTLVPKTDPILREQIPEITDFTDPALRDLIHDMCYSIQSEQLQTSAAGMAANQWGIRKRIFLYTPMGSDKPAEIMINPSYQPYLRPDETEYKIVAGYEGCFSIPLAVGLINRYDAIVVSYLTPAGKMIERILEGWEARVFQHETDHLNGKLYDGKLDQYDGPEILDRIVFESKTEMENWLSTERKKRNTVK